MKRAYILLIVSVVYTQFLLANESDYSVFKKNGLPDGSADTTYLKTVVEFLSADKLLGRLPGTPEYDMAADFAENEFAKHGLIPFPGYESYRQKLKIWQNLFVSPCELEILHFSKGSISPKFGSAYNFRGYTGTGKIQLETVFCGYGIHTESYNDYENIDVEGKAVMIFKGNPEFRPEDYQSFSISGRAATAKEMGASAVIFMTIPGSDRAATIGSLMFGDGEYIPDMPLIQIDEATANILLEGSNHNLKEKHSFINSEQRPASEKLKSEVFVNVKTDFKPDADSYNIIAYLEGADPIMKDEFIVVSAHLDHVGYQCDIIYPGANDNASGSAAVIELARLFSLKRPARSIIFVLLTGEEQGLIGAKHFVDNLPTANEQITAAFNFDCIAVGDSIQLGSGLSNPNLYDIALNQDAANLVIRNTWKGGGADLTPFYKAGIPGLYFVTRYSYTHLHLPSDKVSTLNMPLFKEIVDFGYKVISEVANGDYIREDLE
jgi:hypothetical protein